MSFLEQVRHQIRTHFGLRRAASEESELSSRHVIISGSQQSCYVKNKISTAKYNVFTFLPKFLGEQFSRYANLFFLFISILQQIPDVSPTGRFTTMVPFVLVLICSAVKELVEDFKRHRADCITNNTESLVLTDGLWKKKQWKSIVVGDVIRVLSNEFFPSDMVLLATSEENGLCYNETANLDGETNYKIRQALPVTSSLSSEVEFSQLEGYIECEGPNNRLYRFIGNLAVKNMEKVPLSSDQVTLRGSQLRNTQWVVGVAIYTGKESKIMQNSTAAPVKHSNMDQMVNVQVLFLFLILIFLALSCAVATHFFESRRLQNHWYLKTAKEANFFWEFITFVILFNNLVPISLQVTLEFVKFFQAIFINLDLEMFHKETDTPALARTSNINEELGQVKYIFTDKTGTLTNNVMELKKFSVAGIQYGASGLYHSKVEEDMANIEREPMLRQFMLHLATCHSVVPEPSAKDPNVIVYQSSSPDEDALVKAAASVGFKFKQRKATSVIIETRSGNLTFDVLNVIEFTSERKRMSVVVRSSNDEIYLLCKGADSVIFPRLAASDPNLEAAVRDLALFAADGFRTLCIAQRRVSEKEYTSWSETFRTASTSLGDREQAVAAAADLIERELGLVGVTGIEDELQLNVPETISRLSLANIKIWVLTGDRMETAINIGYSANLISPTTLVLSDAPDNAEALECWFSRMLTEQMIARSATNRPKTVSMTKDLALVITGQVLENALRPACIDLFLDLALVCKTVICCRVSPLQKAQVVTTVRKNVESAITLAIGDGGNDVGMIQAAHVGIGISGKEGLQAANASDYSIAQFRFLVRLLLVHGSWNYLRLSKLILYSFYKNVCLYLMQLWFAFDNGFSGQVLFDKWFISLYNLFFTSLPPIAIGLFERVCSSKARENFPPLYRTSQLGHSFNVKIFWMWITVAVMHSLGLYYIPKLAYHQGIVLGDGTTEGFAYLGTAVYTCVIVTVCLKAGLEMKTWTLPGFMSIVLSLVSWLCFLVVYCRPQLAFSIAPDVMNMDISLLSSPFFWFLLILMPVLTLLPDVITQVIKQTMFKTTRQIVQEYELEGEVDWEDIDVYRDLSMELVKYKRTSYPTSYSGYAFSIDEASGISQTDVIQGTGRQ